MKKINTFWNWFQDNNQTIKNLINELHKKQVQALRVLEQKEDQFQKNIILINELRRIILLRYCK